MGDINTLAEIPPRTCCSCVHYNALHLICVELSGHMYCDHCRKPFKLNLKKRRPYECATCGCRGSSRAIEDVSDGRPSYCPGWEKRPVVAAPQVQGSLFDE
jgi:hypothetical protein